MRFMVIVKANEKTEAGQMPTSDELAAMGAYNEELIKAGVMLDGGGLKPSSNGARISFSGGSGTPVDGPFAETKELIAGYWLWQCKDLEEAKAWAQRAPMLEGDVLEIRPFFEIEDFPESEGREVHERLMAENA